MIDTREVYVRSYGLQLISSEKFEELAIATGIDNMIFFYVPDDVFQYDDYELAEYVSENVED